jgi:DNA polymerase I
MTDTLRSCIITEEGYTFLSLDASQVELRVLAILSQDPQMLADLATGDLHMATAVRMFGDEDAVGEDGVRLTGDAYKAFMKKRRYDAKQCNFAIVYGADAFKLSQMFECSLEEAEQFMAEHQTAYPVLYTWMEGQVRQAKEDGYVVNMFGRIRPLPDLASHIWKIREKAEREVVNTKVQGTAVDIVKKCMLLLRTLFNRDIRLVLQVHDEILWECPDGLLQEAMEISKNELPKYFPSYPFTMTVGKVYGEMKEIGK